MQIGPADDRPSAPTTPERARPWFAYALAVLLIVSVNVTLTFPSL